MLRTFFWVDVARHAAILFWEEVLSEFFLDRLARALGCKHNKFWSAGHVLSGIFSHQPCRWCAQSRLCALKLFSVRKRRGTANFTRFSCGYLYETGCAYSPGLGLYDAKKKLTIGQRTTTKVMVHAHHKQNRLVRGNGVWVTRQNYPSQASCDRQIRLGFFVW